MLPSNQRRIRDKPSLNNLHCEKILKNKQNTIEEQGRKQIHATSNQSERLVALTNKDNHKNNIWKTC